MLLRVLSSIVRPTRRAAPQTARVPLDPARQNVLNVGGGDRSIALPSHYAEWNQLFLDIDPKAKPDIVLDARALRSLPAGQFDAVHCSHNLEHYYEHDVSKVLVGFAHVLKQPEGFIEIRVPDVHAVAQQIVAHDRDMGDTLYTSPAGPIRVVDVLYGFTRALEQSGEDFYAHKTGFTRRALRLALEHAGFTHAYALAPIGVFEIRTVALRAPPTALHGTLFGIDADSEAL
jgi:predicted SAM-dependent methyltransferase